MRGQQDSSETHLTPDKCKTSAKLQKELLQVVDDSAFQFAFRVFRKFFQSPKLNDIRAFHRVFRHLDFLPFKSQPVNLIFICAEGKAFVKGTVILAFQLA